MTIGREIREAQMISNRWYAIYLQLKCQILAKNKPRNLNFWKFSHALWRQHFLRHITLFWGWCLPFSKVQTNTYRWVDWNKHHLRWFTSYAGFRWSKVEWDLIKWWVEYRQNFQSFDDWSYLIFYSCMIPCNPVELLFINVLVLQLLARVYVHRRSFI